METWTNTWWFDFDPYPNHSFGAVQRSTLLFEAARAVLKQKSLRRKQATQQQRMYESCGSSASPGNKNLANGHLAGIKSILVPRLSAARFTTSNLVPALKGSPTEEIVGEVRNFSLAKRRVAEVTTEMMELEQRTIDLTAFQRKTAD